MSNQDVALSLARAGFFIFPCDQNKKPLIPPIISWAEESTTNETTIQNWWLGQRGALPAIDCGKSGLVVIDCDRHGGPDGVKAFKDLCKKHNQSFDNLLIVKTPSGGRHIYFRQPSNGKLFTNSRGDLPKGCDVRGSGGYVIGIGAELANGKKYESTKTITDAKVELPAWISGVLQPATKNQNPEIPQTQYKPGSEREQAYAAAACDNIASELTACSPGARNEQLNKSAFRLGTMCVRGWIDRSKIEIRLTEAAEACGLVKDDGRRAVTKTINSGITAGLKSPHDDLDNRPKQEAPRNGHADVNTSKPLIQSSADFAANFVPPDYLISGLLQRRFVYSLTAPTGTGKTAVALCLAFYCDLGKVLDGREIEKVKVLYLAGENPDDVRMRWIKQCDENLKQPSDMNVFFLPGTPPIFNEQIRERINTETKQHGPFGLVIVDTSAAYFTGDDENSSTQLGAHARLLRTFTGLPGGPTVLVTCHPVKNPDMDNLLPRGGGGFLNEMDGNLVLIKKDVSLRLHWHGKFRGPDFAPIAFKLQAGTTDLLKDSKDRHIWSVTATPISETEQMEIEAAAQKNQDNLLIWLQTNNYASLTDTAEKIGWKYKNGRPDKSAVNRHLNILLKAKLIIKKRGKFILTESGKKAADEAEKVVV